MKKKHFDMICEVTSIAHFRIMADSEDEAAELIRTMGARPLAQLPMEMTIDLPEHESGKEVQNETSTQDENSPT